MEEAEYKNLLGEVQGLRKEVAQIDRDLAKDRQDIGSFRVAMESMTAELKEFRGMIGTNADKVKDKVTDALEPAIGAVDSLKKEIKAKKTIVIHTSKIIDFIKSKLK